MSRPKISVIVPVYNVEDYITEALESLLAQSMIDDIEVIIVDDGSTDESRYITERYALDYDNFHVYHKENEGQGIARNFGLNLAKGEYIHFFDSDDYLPSNAYETLYGLALKNTSDIAVGNALRFALYNVWQDNLFKNSFNDIAEVIDSITLREMPSLLWDTVTWNKLYRKDFLTENNIEFPKMKISYQDIPFSFEAYFLAESISITPEVCYYWRLRSDNTSVTQQDKNIRNFRDRLYILEHVNGLMDKYDVSGNLRDGQYIKWMNHDLKFFLKRFDKFPENLHRDLFDEVCKLVDVIPDELIERLNSYKKVVFKMIKNRDYDNFLKFAPLENDLYEDPVIPEFIDDEYKGYFDFKKAMKEEELLCDLADAHFDDENLLLDMEANLNYLSNEDTFKMSAAMIDSKNEYPLDIIYSDNACIIIPLCLIEDKNHLQVEVRYEFGDFEKTATLKNRHRQSFEFDGCFVDLNAGMHSYLFIDVRQKNGNCANISDISFDGSKFTLKGKSKNRIDNVYIENIMTFEKVFYPLNYVDSTTFHFEIPYQHILDSPVKKWEINCEKSPNSIRISDKFEFFTNHNRTRFLDTRNKILIENDPINVSDEMGHLSRLYNRLVQENHSLKKENRYLNNKVSEFQSRKAIRIADKLKFNK
ncbi:glycosyltransferase [Methanobrevibacter sp.]|uniref:glycosyltransferase n=1 Tax=Methanobrevibacter sp. TaxID=66852 RepID=UPI00386F9CF1